MSDKNEMEIIERKLAVAKAKNNKVKTFLKRTGLVAMASMAFVSCETTGASYTYIPYGATASYPNTVVEQSSNGGWTVTQSYGPSFDAQVAAAYANVDYTRAKTEDVRTKTQIRKSKEARQWLDTGSKAYERIMRARSRY